MSLEKFPLSQNKGEVASGYITESGSVVKGPGSRKYAERLSADADSILLSEIRRSIQAAEGELATEYESVTTAYAGSLKRQMEGSDPKSEDTRAHEVTDRREAMHSLMQKRQKLSALARHLEEGGLSEEEAGLLMGYLYPSLEESSEEERRREQATKIFLARLVESKGEKPERADNSQTEMSPQKIKESLAFYFQRLNGYNFEADYSNFPFRQLRIEDQRDLLKDITNFTAKFFDQPWDSQKAKKKDFEEDLRNIQEQYFGQ